MMDLTYKVTTDTARVYKLRSDKGWGWANITIREWPRGGSIDVQSDFDSYSNTWSAVGDRPFREFLLQLDFGYFMGKAKPGYMRFDADATAAAVRRMIIEQRRDGELAQRDAREMYDNLYMLHEAISEESFYAAWYEYFGRLCDGCDAPNVHKPDAQAVSFWEYVWPVACEFWRKELAALPVNDNEPASSDKQVSEAA